MGLFGKLFDKKICDICGDEIGLLGNRKLEDGNCCKKCAKKLSPWFNERRESTVEEIKAQLAYREANKAEVAKFNPTRVMGDNMKVMLDEGAGVFMVTDERDWREENPDVIQFSQVTAVDIDIHEHRNEVKRTVRDSDGSSHQEGFNPPRYRYNYRFRCTIRVNHPYFDEIAFDLSSTSVEVKTGGMYEFLDAISDGTSAGSTYPPTMEDRRNNPEYRKYEEEGRELRTILMSGRNRGAQQAPAVQAAPAAAPAAAPEQKVTCPWCGASTGTATGTCECCGGSLKG